jgi:hypothetical protein
MENAGDIKHGPDGHLAKTRQAVKGKREGTVFWNLLTPHNTPLRSIK